MTDDVVQFARDARPFLGDRRACALLALALEPGDALLGVAGLLELETQRETGEPDDGEEHR